MFDRNKTCRRVCGFGIVWAAALGLLGPAAVQAQTQEQRIKVLEERLAASLKAVEQLTARVAELERAAVGASPGVAAAAQAASAPRAAPQAQADQARAIIDLQNSVSQISDSLARARGDTGIALHGFADVNAGVSSAPDPHRLRGFNAGTLDVYLTPQLGDRVRSLIEVVFEQLPNGEHEIDPERLQLGYTVSDALTVWAGRFHTPVGLWNTSYHHGANIQTSIFRPRFIDFEDKGGIVPMHTIGLWGSGKTALGPGRLTYDLYVGNNPSLQGRQLEIHGFSDVGGRKAWGFNLGYQPNGAASGLTLGTHGLFGSVDSLAGTGAAFANTRLRMTGAYVGYDANDWELLGEAYRFSNLAMPQRTRHGSTLAFVQLGRVIGAWTPYLRVERTRIDAGDSYFTSLEHGVPYRRFAAGVRYELDVRAALKFEWSRTSESAFGQLDANGASLAFSGARYRRAVVEYSIAF